MSLITSFAIAFLICAFLSAILSRAIVPLLLRWRVIDVPNARSSHTTVTPRGGGIAPAGVLLVLAIGAFAFLGGPAYVPALVAGGGVLLAVSLIDDVRSLPVRVRLAAHAFAVGLALTFLLGEDRSVFGNYLPPALEWIVLAIGWIWFTNLFNFMDGIDGISGTELVSIGIGITAVVLMASPLDHQAGSTLLIGAALLAGAGAGFLSVNWSPARVFMGDVGSVTLGFLAGGLLILLAASGHWAAAAILPAYYVVDATLTLALRIKEGDKLAEAHPKHAYQRAVRGGLSHSAVCLRIAGLNAALIGLALLSVRYPWLCAIGAYVLTLAVFVDLRCRAP